MQLWPTAKATESGKGRGARSWRRDTTPGKDPGRADLCRPGRAPRRHPGRNPGCRDIPRPPARAPRRPLARAATPSKANDAPAPAMTRIPPAIRTDQAYADRGLTSHGRVGRRFPFNQPGHHAARGWRRARYDAGESGTGTGTSPAVQAGGGLAGLDFGAEPSRRAGRQARRGPTRGHVLEAHGQRPRSRPEVDDHRHLHDRGCGLRRHDAPDPGSLVRGEHLGEVTDLGPDTVGRPADGLPQRPGARQYLHDYLGELPGQRGGLARTGVARSARCQPSRPASRAAQPEPRCQPEPRSRERQGSGPGRVPGVSRPARAVRQAPEPGC